MKLGWKRASGFRPKVCPRQPTPHPAVGNSEYLYPLPGSESGSEQSARSTLETPRMSAPSHQCGRSSVPDCADSIAEFNVTMGSSRPVEIPATEIPRIFAPPPHPFSVAEQILALQVRAAALEESDPDRQNPVTPIHHWWAKSGNPENCP